MWKYFSFSFVVTVSWYTNLISGMVWVETLLFLTGKLGITAAFGISYVHTAEMLPTVVRSGGVGSASTFARVGALVAPFVPLLVGVYYLIIRKTVYMGYIVYRVST